MKKNSLFLLLLTGILAGCGPKIDATDIENQKPQEQSYDDEGAKTDEQTHEDSEEEQGGKTEETKTHTKTITTSGEKLTSLFGDRTSFDNSSQKDNVTKLENYFNSEINEENVLKSLTFSGFVQTLDSAVGSHLCLGSSSSSGKISFTWNEKITKIEVTVINYYKTYSYQNAGGLVSGLTIDNDAHFFIDTDNNSLEIDKNETPEYKTFSKEYSNGTTSFAIESNGGRVLVKELTITWSEANEVN